MTAILNALATVHEGWFAFGVIVFTVGLVVFIWAAIGRHGNVSIGPDPESLSEATTVVMTIRPTLPVAPNHVPTEEFFPLAGYLTAAVDAAADATEELTRVIEAKDPLDVTVELETVDYSVPLFYAIRRPRPYVAETFTEGITRAQIERALAAKES